LARLLAAGAAQYGTKLLWVVMKIGEEAAAFFVAAFAIGNLRLSIPGRLIGNSELCRMRLK
jgi:hypothetical protein